MSHPPLMILPPQSEQSKALAKARSLKKGLYADYPGTGPKDETCGSCKHLVRKQMASVYLKCGLCRQWWTGGGGTDIKARSPACSKWTAEDHASTPEASK